MSGAVGTGRGRWNSGTEPRPTASGRLGREGEWLASKYRKAAEVLDAQVFADHPLHPPAASSVVGSQP